MAAVAEIVHGERQVTIVTARLVPPWFDVFVLMSNGDRQLGVSVPIVLRGSLRRAFSDAGFMVAQRTQWLPPP